MVLLQLLPCPLLLRNELVFLVLYACELIVALVFLSLNLVLQLLNLALVGLCVLHHDPRICVFALVNVGLQVSDVLNNLLADFALDEHFMGQLGTRKRLLSSRVFV